MKTTTFFKLLSNLTILKRDHNIQILTSGVHKITVAFGICYTLTIHPDFIVISGLTIPPFSINLQDGIHFIEE